jgi:curli biogenesis system outer membrane secretion channel CsgG
MVKRSAIFVVVALAGGLMAGSAMAQAYGTNQHPPAGTPDLPQCAHPIGTVAIKDPDRDWWTPLGLDNPEAVIKLFASRSNCLRVVARGAALAMRNQERELGDSGEAQRGQNFGKGQVLQADYLLIPDIVTSNGNSGGGGVGLGGLIGNRFGPLGAVVGGISVKSSEAHTLLTLINARTTEQEYVAEGTSKKTDVGFSGGGWGGYFGGVGGGYSNTAIGQVIAAAYYNAFIDLVGHMQQDAPGQAAAAAPIQAYNVTSAMIMHKGPGPASPRMRDFRPGDLVYPTGNKNGVWWEVDDENGNRGWVSSAYISPRG